MLPNDESKHVVRSGRVLDERRAELGQGPREMLLIELLRLPLLTAGGTRQRFYQLLRTGRSAAGIDDLAQQLPIARGRRRLQRRILRGL